MRIVVVPLVMQLKAPKKAAHGVIRGAHGARAKAIRVRRRVTVGMADALQQEVAVTAGRLGRDG